MHPSNKKAVVALSGGVDSSVAAALLKRAEFNLQGVYMQLWQVRSSVVDSSAEKRALEVAKILDIPFRVLDLRKEFKKKVVDYFLAEYGVGRTPNPCVVCNREIKFGLMLEKAKELGADFLATGHYAFLRSFGASEGQARFSIFRAKDENKDQTYFLWKLTQKQLKHILFPLGEVESKQKVRDLAKKFGLPTTQVKESNDVCFLQAANLHEFLQQQIKTKRGKIRTIDGDIVGEHKGLCFYTIGQRKGINIAGLTAEARRAKAGLPWFAVEKDIKKNTLIVSQNEKDLLRKELTAQEVNWISGIEPKFPLKVKAKIRYASELSTAVVKEKIGPRKYRIIFAKSQRAITPGQSVVFYSPAAVRGTKAGESDELLGGGIIN